MPCVRIQAAQTLPGWDMQMVRPRPRSYLTQVAKAITSVMVSFPRKTYSFWLLLVAFSPNGYLPFFWTNISLGQLRVVGQWLSWQEAPETVCPGVQGTPAGPPQAPEVSQWQDVVEYFL